MKNVRAIDLQSQIEPFGYPIKGYFPKQELLQIHSFNNSFKKVSVVLDLL
jgi:hypothetical protein